MTDTPGKHPTWEDINQLDRRVNYLEEQVAHLLEVLANQDSKSTENSNSTPVPAEVDANPENPSSTKIHLDEEISVVMQHIVVLMKSGDTDEAFKEFQALSRSELAQQPVTAATIAAAICVTQGDFQAGIKALGHVQQYSDDPRIEAIRQRLLQQANAPGT